jgi:hypothetical protein
MAAEPHLAPKDIMVALGVSKSRAYEIARECDRVKFGKTVRVPESAFNRWLEAHRLPGSASPAARPPDPRISAQAAAYHRKQAVRAARAATHAAHDRKPGSTIRLTRRRD